MEKIEYPNWYTTPPEIMEEYSVKIYEYDDNGTLLGVETIYTHTDEHKIDRIFKEEVERIEKLYARKDAEPGWCKVVLTCFDEELEARAIGKLTARSL